MALGLFNVLTCILAVFDVDVFTKKYNIFSYSLNKAGRNHPSTPSTYNQLPNIIGNMLDDSLHYVAPDEKPMTAEQVYAIKKENDIMIFPRNTMKSVQDIHSDEQLDSLWNEHMDNFAYNIFKPSVTSGNYKYNQSQQDEDENSGTISQSYIG